MTQTRPEFKKRYVGSFVGARSKTATWGVIKLIQGLVCRAHLPHLGMRVARVMPTGQAAPARALAGLKECAIFNGVTQNRHGTSVMHHRISTVRTNCT